MKTELINLLILIANIGILALNVKLYTEYFKDRSISKRGNNAKV
jgi:Tfp pilus assembly major pilin PilA